MGIFKLGGNNNDTREKAINSDEYERCLKRMSELDSRIRSYEVQVELIKTDVANLRGKFNQRLKGLQQDEQKEEQKEINTSELLPFG